MKKYKISEIPVGEEMVYSGSRFLRISSVFTPGIPFLALDGKFVEKNTVTYFLSDIDTEVEWPNAPKPLTFGDLKPGEKFKQGDVV